MIELQIYNSIIGHVLFLENGALRRNHRMIGLQFCNSIIGLFFEKEIDDRVADLQFDHRSEPPSPTTIGQFFKKEVDDRVAKLAGTTRRDHLPLFQKRSR